MKISEHLIKKHRFTKYRVSKSMKLKEHFVDINKFSCMLRIGDIHYLFYSDDYKYFSLGVKHEKPKGKIGGEKGQKVNWNTIIIPKLIESKSQADNMIKAIV